MTRKTQEEFVSHITKFHPEFSHNVHTRGSLSLVESCKSNLKQTKIADLVQITPEDFDKKASQAIEDNINLKYANRVIQKIGLCVCLYDLLSASEGLIGHGTGLVNVNGMQAIFPEDVRMKIIECD